MKKRRGPILRVSLPVPLLACCKSLHRFVTVVKPGFHMIATRAEIELFLSQRSLSLRSALRSLESGFHMIAVIAAIAEPLFFFVSDRSDHSVRTDHMETRLKRTDTYTTLTDDLSLDRKCDPSQSGCVLRK